METMHTPGPWQVVQPEGFHGWEIWSWHGFEEGDILALVLSVDPDEPGDGRANARLIAAAPDLLEACVAVAEWLPLTGERDSVVGRLIKDALAKAGAGG